MESKYLIVGLNILGVSLLLGIYGYLVNDSRLIGVALSGVMAGTVISVLGWTHTEYAVNLYADYYRLVRNIVIPLMEDLGLTGVLPSVIFSKGKAYLFVSPGKPILDKISGSVIGIYEGIPYIAVPIPEDLPEVGRATRGYELESVLRDVLINTYGIGSNVEVTLGSDIKILIYNVPTHNIHLSKDPLNPVDLALLITTARSLHRSLVLKERVIRGDVYQAILKEVAET